MSKRSAALFMSIMLSLASAGPAAAAPPAPKSTQEIGQSIASGKKTIIFFLNPYGVPCRKQNEILTALQKSRKNDFNLVYVNANDENNRKAFYDYGVRGLPMVVLVDSSGMIGKVFPPGIQSSDTLTAALDGVK